MQQGYVHSLESFGSVDGPGVRVVIFLSGCKMRCQYCHNADTWDMYKGKLYTADELLDRAQRYESYWGREGGITVSGGEPLLQIDFLTELFEKAKERGIHTVLDTSGGPFSRHEPFFGEFNRLMKVTDLLLLDIKHIDQAAHKNLTGMGNSHILDMASYLSEIGKPVWIRHVLVPGLTDSKDALERLSAFVAGLNNVEKAEILPYHTFGAYKWEELGMEYPLKGVEPPTDASVREANEILQKAVKKRGQAGV